MTYVEFPVDNVVAVHWHDPDDPPPDDGGGTRRCWEGTWEWGWVLNPPPAGLTPTVVDPWIDRRVGSPTFGAIVNEATTFDGNGIEFGYPYDLISSTLMKPSATFHIQATWDVTNTMDRDMFGLAVIHTEGYRDYNQFPNSAGIPFPVPGQPNVPFYEFPSAAGTLDWTWDMQGILGPWYQQTTGTPPAPVWDDPTRFDPNYGGAIWLIVLQKPVSSDVWGIAGRGNNFWHGRILGQQVNPGGSIFGQRMTIQVTNTCMEQTPPVEHHSPVWFPNTTPWRQRGSSSGGLIDVDAGPVGTQPVKTPF